MQIERSADVIIKAGMFLSGNSVSWSVGVEPSTFEASTRRLCDPLLTDAKQSRTTWDFKLLFLIESRKYLISLTVQYILHFINTDPTTLSFPSTVGSIRSTAAQ